MPRPSSLAAPVLLAGALVAALVAGLVTVREDPRPVVAANATTAPPPRPPREGVAAAAVLKQWDLRRAAAWTAGDVVALRSLYVPGSRAGERDARMLRAWLGRGWRVTALQTQVLRLRVLTGEPRRWRLLVVDQVVSGSAVGPGRRRALPRDGPTARVVELRRVAGRWLVASVRQARPVASTDSTSRSRNE
ncbi:hypothetical protein [Nocardioides sp. SYSU D00038]|uniref:hypothetical protein n=1 Tax=Nocardioides sp. SYSU D00038 TaxID=2812554 RepID=UPI0019688E08|nr:hypothetical protein [Nocardioides sp. SYSU D00038]